MDCLLCNITFSSPISQIAFYQIFFFQYMHTKLLGRHNEKIWYTLHTSHDSFELKLPDDYESVKTCTDLIVAVDSNIYLEVDSKIAKEDMLYYKALVARTQRETTQCTCTLL